MNSSLYYARMTAFSIAILLTCVCFTHLIDFTAVKLFVLALIMIVSVILQLSKNTKLVDDNRLSVMYILAGCMFMFVFFRDIFDPYIPIGSFYVFSKASDDIISGSGLFIDYNLNIIILTYTIILIYNIVNRIKKTQ